MASLAPSTIAIPSSAARGVRQSSAARGKRYRVVRASRRSPGTVRSSTTQVAVREWAAKSRAPAALVSLHVPPSRIRLSAALWAARFRRAASRRNARSCRSGTATQSRGVTWIGESSNALLRVVTGPPGLDSLPIGIAQAGSNTTKKPKPCRRPSPRSAEMILCAQSMISLASGASGMGSVRGSWRRHWPKCDALCAHSLRPTVPK